jgi:hypothetical protein
MCKAYLNENGDLVVDDKIFDVKYNINLRFSNITSLPENLTVGGGLYLRGTNITSLPKNLTVGGYLDLSETNITSLPENLTVGGYLDLEGTNITSLPKSLTVGGSLYLSRTKIKKSAADKVNKNIPPILSWKNGKYIKVDGIFSEVVSHKGNVWKVKPVNRDKLSYVISDGYGRFSHGKTIKEAKEDLIYKISNRDTSRFDHLTSKSEVSFEEAIKLYRVITGACAQGTRQFVESQEKVQEFYTVEEIIKLTENSYGGETFKNFFNDK